MALTPEQRKRYSRQLSLPGFGEKAQEKLSRSSVLVIGAGGLGSSAILYLAGVGIGKLGIADYDTVDLSNLPRQIIHAEKNINNAKTKSAKQKINELNSEITVEQFPEKITFHNARKVFSDYDFIIDATDDVKTKFMINEICIKLNKPFSYGGVNAYEGQTTTIIPGKSACLRCMFKNAIIDDLENIGEKLPVFNTVPGIIGAIQATECIKYLTNTGKLLTDTLLVFDSQTTRFTKINFNKNEECKVCY